MIRFKNWYGLTGSKLYLIFIVPGYPYKSKQVPVNKESVKKKLSGLMLTVI